MSKNKLFNPKKDTPKHRKKYVDEWNEFYHLELWDRYLVVSLLNLEVDDSDLDDFFSCIHEEKETAFYEGYEQARDNIKEVLTSDEPTCGTTYDTRKAVLALDEE